MNAFERANLHLVDVERRADTVRARPLDEATRQAMGLAPGAYAALSIPGETAVGIVARGASRAEVQRVVAELRAHRDRADRAARYWADRCVEAYDRACDRVSSGTWAVAR